MRNLATTVLTILLLTLFQPAGGCSPPIESKDMPKKFNLTFEDPMELRARGKGAQNDKGSNQFGNAVFFEPNVRNSQSILKTPDLGKSDVWTLALGIDVNEQDLPDNYSFIASIEFGAGGATQVVEVDWIQGMAITLPGSAFQVTAIMDDSLTPPAGGQVYLKATAAKGTALQTHPTRTVAYAVLGGGATVAHIIPPFAKSVTLLKGGTLAESPFLADKTYTFLNPAGNATGAFLGTDFALYDGAIPIPKGSYQLQLTNASANPMAIQAIYNIGL